MGIENENNMESNYKMKRKTNQVWTIWGCLTGFIILIIGLITLIIGVYIYQAYFKEHTLLISHSPEETHTIEIVEKGAAFSFGPSSIRIKYDGEDMDRIVFNDGKTLQGSNVQVDWMNDHEATLTIYGEEQSPDIIKFRAEASPPFSEQENTQDSSNAGQETGADSSEDIYSGQEEEKQDNLSEEQSQEESLEEYAPGEDDVVVHSNELKNKDILENFMEVAGENGEDNENEIKVVRDEGTSGVLIYDLKSRYDEHADQGWIDVSPDLSYYRPSENEVHNIFNNAPQQCGYMSKDEMQGYYKLYECRTHWEFHLIPMVEDNE